MANEISKFTLTIHINDISYPTTLLTHREVPYIIYFYDGEPQSMIDVMENPNYKDEDQNYISGVYEGTINRFYDYDFKHDTKIYICYQLLTIISIPIFESTIGDLIKKRGIIDFELDANTYFHGWVQVIKNDGIRLTNSGYKLIPNGEEPDIENAVDLYDIIETNTAIPFYSSASGLKYDDNEIPIKYIPYDNNKQYIFKSQMNTNQQWINRIFIWDGKSDKQDFYLYNAQGNIEAINPKYDFFNDSYIDPTDNTSKNSIYRPIPINLIPNYEMWQDETPTYWGRFVGTTADDEKYTYKIWKQNDNVAILKGKWVNSSTGPNNYTNPNNNEDTNPLLLNCEFENIILELQAAGARGGDGYSGGTSFYPTWCAASGGGGGGFIRCLININEYNENNPLLITLTPQKQNTDYNASVLPYSYINLKEGLIQCYNGQPGHEQKIIPEKYSDVAEVLSSGKNKWLIPGGVGGVVILNLSNPTDKKYLNYTVNTSNPLFSKRCFGCWPPKLEENQSLWSNIDSYTASYSPDAESWGTAIDHDYTVQDSDITSYNAGDEYLIEYINSSTENDIVLTYNGQSITLPKGKREGSGSKRRWYYVKLLNPVSDNSLKNNIDCIKLEENTDNNIVIVYNNDSKEINYHFNNDTPITTNLTSDQQYIGSFYYQISNANSDDYNNEGRENITCKILDIINGGCGGNSNGDSSTSGNRAKCYYNVNSDLNIFNWKQVSLNYTNSKTLIKGGNGGDHRIFACWTIATPIDGSTENYHYFGGSGGGGSGLGYGQNGILTTQIPAKKKSEGDHKPSDGYKVDTTYFGGGGGGGCYYYHDEKTWGNYVNGIDGQPACFIIHW